MKVTDLPTILGSRSHVYVGGGPPLLHGHTESHIPQLTMQWELALNFRSFCLCPPIARRAGMHYHASLLAALTHTLYYQ